MQRPARAEETNVAAGRERKLRLDRRSNYKQRNAAGEASPAAGGNRRGQMFPTKGVTGVERNGNLQKNDGPALDGARKGVIIGRFKSAASPCLESEATHPPVSAVTP